MAERLQNFVGGASSTPATVRRRRSLTRAPATPTRRRLCPAPPTWTPPGAAAAAAFVDWRDSTPSQRSMLLLKLADAIESRAEDFISAEGRNTGKPLCADPLGGDPPSLGSAPLLRRGRQGARRPRRRRVHAGAHFVDPQGADRCRGPGDSLELSVDDGDLEDRPGSGCRQHDRAQTVRHHAGHRP